ncbi:MAG: HD domain-containing protein [Candidatus Hydrogenedens sp.]|nr:HD domain-containing protein [Candidatus Hydrogenedens sp.]
MAPLALNPSQERIAALLRVRLKEKRLAHALSVTEHLADFGPELGLERDRLITAALLHDLCRNFEDDIMLARAAEYGLPIEPIHEARPILLHGPVAAEEARRYLGLTDEDVYEAVYWHTTGTPGLGLLGRALMVADFSEPLRKYPEAAETRAVLAREGFGAALRYMAQAKQGFAEKKTQFHPETRAFCDWVMRGCPPVPETD